MNEQLIQRHNENIKPNDIVYMLGDFAFCSQDRTEEFLKRLNGKKYYVFGNHDKIIKKERFKKYFKSMKNYSEISIDGNYCVLFHYEIAQWNKAHYGSYHFHGHVHSVTVPDSRKYDIGVDGHNCYPWNIRELFELLKPYNPIKHHN